jgi:hypothetical protein
MLRARVNLTADELYFRWARHPLGTIATVSVHELANTLSWLPAHYCDIFISHTELAVSRLVKTRPASRKIHEFGIKAGAKAATSFTG